MLPNPTVFKARQVQAHHEDENDFVHITGGAENRLAGSSTAIVPLFTSADYRPVQDRRMTCRGIYSGGHINEA